MGIIYHACGVWPPPFCLDCLIFYLYYMTLSLARNIISTFCWTVHTFIRLTLNFRVSHGAMKGQGWDDFISKQLFSFFFVGVQCGQFKDRMLTLDFTLNKVCMWKYISLINILFILEEIKCLIYNILRHYTFVMYAHCRRCYQWCQ